ncbi:Retrovirus-related Pol polyprotein from transposon RE1 [Vitis vinifera]|uniref:Retrovirus-related Pol polyprotein from transposon RE1 n=1 Tax=Vitis vinifera TaxID=29760 RepID=A0A438KKK6_VITVI|nr:Retrovirus-related Pol polyprotein from transposon RE1 [Vitis vinifera]
MAQIVGYSTAMEIWNALNQIYFVSSMVWVTEIHTKLQKLRKDGLSVGEYIQKLKSICNSLVAIGKPISEKDYLIYLFSGLDQFSYPATTHPAAKSNIVPDTNWSLECAFLGYSSHHKAYSLLLPSSIMDLHVRSVDTDLLASSRTHNILPMVTRFKVGIYKPKLLLSVSQHNKTWYLVPSPSSGKVIGCKWVSKLKLQPDGQIERYKAHLVVKGYHQTKDNWMFIMPFLHGDLAKDVFMEQPLGFIGPLYPTHVYKLDKSLYSLKQSPRAWYTKLSNSLLYLGFVTSKNDSFLFICHSSYGLLLVLVYVDDIIVIGSHSTQAWRFIAPLLVFTSAKQNISLISLPGLLCWMPSHVPLLCPPTQISLFMMVWLLKMVRIIESFVGALQYCNMTRPDIAFAPSLDFNITFYMDADWASCPNDRHSTSGYYLFLGSNLVSWSSSKQKVVSRSTTESEYRGVANRVAKIAWTESLLRELSITPTRPFLILCDNISATYLVVNPILHAQTKHMEIDYHFVQERVLQRSFSV